MNLTVNESYWKFAKSGAGFTRIDNTFLDLLQQRESAITNKLSIRNLIICGGLNDINANSWKEVANAIQIFCNYVQHKYPNCKIYIGCIGWHEEANNKYIRNQVLQKVLSVYRNCSHYTNATYLKGVEYPMHYYTFFGKDASHPSDIGESYIANAIYQAYQQGQARFFSSRASVKSPTGCCIETGVFENKLQLRIFGNITSKLPDVSTIGTKTINLGTAHEAFIRNVNDLSKIHCQLLLDYGNSHFEAKNAYITVNSNAELIMTFENTTKGTLSNIRVYNYPYRYDLLYF